MARSYGDSLEFLGIDLYLVVIEDTTDGIPIPLTVSIFPDTPIPRYPDSPIPYFSNRPMHYRCHTLFFSNMFVHLLFLDLCCI